MTKIYNAKDVRMLSYPIILNGEIITLKFRGGDPPKRPAIYMTDDAQLQAAIEKNGNYGKLFELDKTSIPTVKTPKLGKTRKSKKVGPIVAKKVEVIKKVEPIVVNEVTSGQKARLWLFDYKPLEGKIVGKMLNNNDKIIKVAKDNNIIFPNWPAYNE